MTKSSIVPDDYRCDHLFLLIGTNPLPNLVAAELLLKERGQVYLVHSSEDAGTAGIARRLSDLLGKPSHNIRTARMIEVKEADAADIKDKVAAAARRLTGTLIPRLTSCIRAWTACSSTSMTGPCWCCGVLSAPA